MIIDKYTPGEKIGPLFKKYVRGARELTLKKDDDFVMIIVGGTGVGKSNLGLWVQDTVVPNPRIQQVALTREDLSKAFVDATKDPVVQRYVQYDEGKLNRRDWNSQWSKELLEIYHDVRGLNIFHVWCTAFPNLLDREFVRERVNALVFCYDKGENRPRQFLLFTKQDLLQFLEKNDGLSMPLLKRYGKAHATMQSYFSQYDGPMREAYLQRKDNRMMERVSAFYQRWGAGNLTFKEAADRLGVSDKTVASWISTVGDEGEHFVTLGSGLRRITPEGMRVLEEISAQKRANGTRPKGFELPRPPSRLTNDNARKGEGVVAEGRAL